MRDREGAGGGKGWSKGAPYGRCIVTGGCSGGAVGTEDSVFSGIENAGDAGEGVKREGLMRLVERLLFPLDSLGIKGLGKVGREEGWKGVAADGMTLTEWEAEGIFEG